MVLPMDDFFDEHNLERLRAADTLLLGATTYTGPGNARSHLHYDTGRIAKDWRPE